MGGRHLHEGQRGGNAFSCSHDYCYDLPGSSGQPALPLDHALGSEWLPSWLAHPQLPQTVVVHRVKKHAHFLQVSARFAELDAPRQGSRKHHAKRGAALRSLGVSQWGTYLQPA